MKGATRDELIRVFHTRALELLDSDDGIGTRRKEIARLLQDLAVQRDILPEVDLSSLRDTGSTATILHRGEDGRGAFMLLLRPHPRLDQSRDRSSPLGQVWSHARFSSTMP